MHIILMVISLWTAPCPWISPTPLSLVASVASQLGVAPTIVEFGPAPGNREARIVGLVCHSSEPLTGYWFVETPLQDEPITGKFWRNVLTGRQLALFNVPDCYPMSRYGFVIFNPDTQIDQVLDVERDSLFANLFVFDYYDHRDVTPFYNQNVKIGGSLWGVPFPLLLGLVLATLIGASIVVRLASRGRYRGCWIAVVVGLLLLVYAGNQALTFRNRLNWAADNFAYLEDDEKFIRYATLLHRSSALLATFFQEDIPKQATFETDLIDYYLKALLPFLAYPRINTRTHPDYYITRGPIPEGYSPVTTRGDLTLSARETGR